MKNLRVPLLMPILILLLLSLTALPVDGQSVTPEGVLRGQVLSLSDSQPVGDALVTIVAAGVRADDPSAADRESMEIRTDVGGRFSVTLAAGQYDVVVEAFGFQGIP